ncbi:hypothetical protein ETAA8_01210 [Anatilimnocola aggregata]|uniref:Cytochrome c domain-containing protein n=1 Tax=Anatilimnocola aggregata TaxID=2528021 RepID=A0A517Y4F8_9BACT|nr:DUF1592 domain-containing protein [Anatilimnocola aggregata]QDU25060.1 hypothetical protein ETAA8_01210 [Anatilimnocola aggregata]
MTKSNSVVPMLSWLCISLWLASVQAESPAFDRTIQPLLAKHCVECHGAEKPKADIRLDGPVPNLVDAKTRERWEKVYAMLVRGEMPPSEKPKLTTDELETLTKWIRQEVERGVLADRGGAGRTTMRRLTRVEYARLLQDVLGLHFANVPLQLHEKLPNDPQNPTPVNDGDLLTFQSLHLKTYVELAERAVTATLATEERPRPFEYRIEARGLTPSTIYATHRGFLSKFPPLDNNKTRLAPVTIGSADCTPDGAVRLPPIFRVDNYLGRDKINVGSWYISLPYFEPHGVLHLRIRAGAVFPSGEGAPILRVSLYNNVDNERFGKQVASFPVTNPADSLRDFDVEIPFDLIDFPYVLFQRSKHVSVRITNDYMPIADRGPPPSGEKGKPAPPWPWDEPQLVIDHVEVTGSGAGDWPPRRHRELLAAGDGIENERDRAGAILASVAAKAWRRRVEKDELAPFVALYEKRRIAGDNRDAALQQPLTAVLTSPFALYAVERKSEQITPLSGIELANRLSLFLWGTGPDRELLELANDSRGTLRDKQILAAQVERMLNDPRSHVFTEDFVRRLLSLDRVETDPIEFNLVQKTFHSHQVAALREERLKNDLALEPVRFFEHLLKENRSLYELIGSEQLVVNDRLARYYGIDEPAGADFRPVAAPPDRCAGWLTMAGVLAAASRGNKESTILRGVYLLDRILGESSGTPPGNVEPLEVQAKADAKRRQLTIREQVKLHTSLNTCQLCHRKIDPLGFVWTDFDYLGQKIVPKPDKPLDLNCSGTFPDGRSFANLDEFASLLRGKSTTDRYQFGEVLIRSLTRYALGRQLTLHDDPLIADLVAAARRDGWRLRNVIISIVLSKSFNQG